MSIRLYDAQNHHILLDGSDPNLHDKGTYTKAEAVQGTWIVYKKPEYNATYENGAEPEYIRVIKPGDGKVDISNVNSSIYHVPDNSNAIVMFQFKYYGGTQKEYIEIQSEVTASFPNGAFSLMVGDAKRWQVYPKPNFGGTPELIAEETPTTEFPVKSAKPI
ncbi:uncharacterized protein LOC114537217 [Dendronephthya gigantea]|uniref:uncharacterized protein LOC114537217 n=1 Tax=Dendronephthya gigantea TaxID=151771 RepID=UPI00106D559C|nr:uncharacterized protein LOC114537217 [Dendronephthya gigantea]